MKTFPPNFDLQIYRQNNKDLKKLNDTQLEAHYRGHGLEEGRIAGPISNRRDLVAHISKCVFSSCLEIGPFDCPVITGENVKYFDVLNQEQLFVRAKAIGRIDNIESIPFINYVSNSARLDIVDIKFDLILSCHAIEHQLDLVAHLNDVSNILNEAGYYVVICPDKRYCFDHFIPETSIADLIDRHTNSTNNHSIKSVIEHRALTCHNDAARHWAGDHGENKVDLNKVISSIDEYRQSIAENHYIDVHSMQFTPASFEKNIEFLFSMKYIDLKVEEIYPTRKNDVEFIVILKKTA